MEVDDLATNYNKNDLILLNTVNYSDEYPSLLIKSIMTNNNILSKVLIKNNIGLELRRKCDNMSAFLIAIFQNNLYIAKKIYKKMHNINDVDKNNNTALIIASKYGYIDIVKYLLQNGASINHQNKNKYTALIYAASYNHPSIVEELINNYANYNVCDIYNSTALIYAVRNCNEAVIDILLKCKYIDIYIVDKNNYTARMYAMSSKCDVILDKFNKIYYSREDSEPFLNSLEYVFDKCFVSIKDFANICNVRSDFD